MAPAGQEGRGPCPAKAPVASWRMGRRSARKAGGVMPARWLRDGEALSRAGRPAFSCVRSPASPVPAAKSLPSVHDSSKRGEMLVWLNR